MIEHKKIGIVIPAFNEGSAIGNTIAPLVREGYTVILVDDCSTDNTSEVAGSFPVHVVRHVINLGQGAALQTGFEYAKKLDVDVIVSFDADGQHDYKEIPKLTEPVISGQYDVALGSRFMRKEDVEAVPPGRRNLLRVAIQVNNIISGMRLTDAHNGFRAFNRKALNSIKMKENRMAHATEILNLIKKNGLTYTEVPVHIEYSDYSKAKGQSSLNSINIIIDLLLNKVFK